MRCDIDNGDGTVDHHIKQDIGDLRVSGTRLHGEETENRTRATVKATMTIKAVSMTADQFHRLTRLRLDQVWPEYSGRAMTRVEMTIDQLKMLIAALPARHWRDIEATREGENVTKLDQVDQGDIEATREGEALPKRDQVDQEDIEATREGETLPKLDQVDQGDIEATREGETLPKLDQVNQGDNEATSEGVTVPKLDQGDQGEGSEDAQVQDQGSDTNEEATELIGDERKTACLELIGDGRRYGKDSQVKRDFKAETGGEEQNEAKAKSGVKKEDNGDTGVKDGEKQQNQAKAKDDIKNEGIVEHEGSGGKQN